MTFKWHTYLHTQVSERKRSWEEKKRSLKICKFSALFMAQHNNFSCSSAMLSAPVLTTTTATATAYSFHFATAFAMICFTFFFPFLCAPFGFGNFVIFFSEFRLSHLCFAYLMKWFPSNLFCLYNLMWHTFHANITSCLWISDFIRLSTIGLCVCVYI